MKFNLILKFVYNRFVFHLVSNVGWTFKVCIFNSDSINFIQKMDAHVKIIDVVLVVFNSSA